MLTLLHHRFAVALIVQVDDIGQEFRLTIAHHQNTVRHRHGDGCAASQCVISFQFGRHHRLFHIATVVDTPADFICVPFADKDNRLILDAAVRTQEPLILDAVNAESTASTVVVFFLVDDYAQIIRLELDGVQLRIKLLDTAAVLHTVLLFAQAPNFHLDFLRSDLSIGNPVQLIQPAQYLAVCKRNDLIVSPRFRYRQRQLPLGLSQSAAMQFEDILLTY